MTDRLKSTPHRRSGSRWPNWSVQRLFETRFRRITIWTVTALSFALTGVYHALTALVKFPADTTTDVIYTVFVVVCYGLLFLMLSRYYSEQRPSVLKIFWRATIYGILLFGALEFIPELSTTGDFRRDTGVPSDLRTILRTVFLSPLVAVFGMALLFQLRELVLFK